MREELQRVTVELAKKSARVQELKRTRDKLEDSGECELAEEAGGVVTDTVHCYC